MTAIAAHFRAADREDHRNHAAHVDPDRLVSIEPGLANQSRVEEPLVEISEIHPVLVEIGEPLRFVPTGV
ncbi:hypothetical protein ACVMB0_003112 [Bradyrhizobium sp. USDA 4451]